MGGPPSSAATKYAVGEIRSVTNASASTTSSLFESYTMTSPSPTESGSAAANVAVVFVIVSALGAAGVLSERGARLPGPTER